MKMKKIALAGVAVLSLSTAVFAADLPTKTPVYKAPAASAAYKWTGFYLGGAGYGWGKVDDNVSFLDALGGPTGVEYLRPTARVSPCNPGCSRLLLVSYIADVRSRLGRN